MKRIPLVDPDIGEEEIKAVTEILQSKWLCQGPKVAEFEQKLAEQLDVEHVVCVSSCTAALHLSLIWIRLQHLQYKAFPLNEVIVPDFTFPATANAVRHAGMQPVFVDVDPHTFTINPDKINQAITDRTRAIIPVHLFGQAANMLPIMEIAEDKKLYIIEDCAGALFTEYEREYVGKFGLTGCFSFTPTKLITTGEGGAITTHDDKLAEWLRLMRSHGRKDVKSIHDLSFPEIGLNYRMTDMQAALGIQQLKRAHEFINKRNKLAQVYSHNLPPYILPQRVYPYTTQHTYTAYAVSLAFSSSRYVVDELQKRGIQAHYTSIALHLEPALNKYGLHKTFPTAEMLSQKTIALPIYPSMTEEDVLYVCNSLTEVLQK